jgi:hypothetical protein
MLSSLKWVAEASRDRLSITTRMAVTAMAATSSATSSLGNVAHQEGRHPGLVTAATNTTADPMLHPHGPVLAVLPVVPPITRLATTLHLGLLRLLLHLLLHPMATATTGLPVMTLWPHHRQA